MSESRLLMDQDEIKETGDKNSTQLIFKNVSFQSLTEKIQKDSGKVIPTLNTLKFRGILCESELAEEIMSSIETIIANFPTFTSLYELYCHFDKKNECEKIEKSYHAGLKQFEKLWSKAGIVNIPPDCPEEKFPKNKVCIKRIYNDNIMIFFQIYFKGDKHGSTRYFKYDVIAHEEKAKIVKRDKLTYVDHIEEINQEIRALTDGTGFLGSVSTAQFCDRVATFLKKWPMVQATVTLEPSGSTLEFNDKLDLILSRTSLDFVLAKALTDFGQQDLLTHQTLLNKRSLV